jgi:hypothetical protein
MRSPFSGVKSVIVSAPRPPCSTSGPYWPLKVSSAAAVEVQGVAGPGRYCDVLQQRTSAAGAYCVDLVAGARRASSVLSRLTSARPPTGRGGRPPGGPAACGIPAPCRRGHVAPEQRCMPLDRTPASIHR